MSFMARLKSHRKAMAGGAVVGIAAVTITTLAVAYDGNPTTEVDLHDGSVWLTNASQMLVGHFNNESRQLDGAARATSADYDVHQQDENVLVHDRQAATIAPVEPASVTVGTAAQLMPGAVVEMGGGSTAILDPEGGHLFIQPTGSIASFDRAEAEPVAELGAGADVAVGLDGTVYAVSRERDAVITVPVDVNGEVGDPRESALGLLRDDSDVDIAAVGTIPVVFDAASGVVATPGAGALHTIEGADGQQARLQQTSPDGANAYLAGPSGLYEIPLAGGEPVVTPAGDGGVPAEPVWLNGCVYSAWAVTGGFVRDCVGEADDLEAQIPNGAESTELVFRVNRDVVVLNDVANGMAWLAMDQLQRVDNWDELTPPEGEENDEEDDSTDETIEVEPPDRSEENQPPVAVDDDFGVRAGRTTVLQVLDNDSDPDGDILTVTLPDGGGDLGRVTPVHDSTAFQIAVQPDESGAGTFVYEVDDGRGGTDQATVRVTVRPDDVNSAPEPKREPTVPVEVGGTVTYNVLQDWRDADGDDIFLTSVEPLPGDGVDFTPDGQVTYRATSGTQGPHRIPIAVSDGRSSAAGTLNLDIRPVGSTKPIANNVHVVVRAGQTATVSPLANDVNPTPEPLRLTRVGEIEGATIVPDFASRTFTYRSDTIGTEYLEYTSAAGSHTAIGYVRVDVVPDDEVDLPPVAVRDVALLPAGGEALVDVLDNDEDPMGGVLVLQSVQMPEEVQGISVSVLNHETVRVTDTGSLTDIATITYRVSNGAHTSEGEIVIIPIPAPTSLRPPVANDDDVVVRAGDVVTIDVLANDYHPNEDELTVVPELVDPLPSPEQGTAFVSQDTVRFKAGDEPGTAYATYEVEDSRGQRDAALISISILEIDEERNQAPRPENIETRALSGGTTQIAVPLHGIDPDGDSVDLVGIDSAPRRGRIVATEQDHFVYEAFRDEHGLDVFTYRVRDRLGAEATATIRVGIAPPEEANQAPYAVTDALFVRPGRQVAVPVLENDSDPDGDAIALVSDGLIVPKDVAGLEAETFGDRLLITAPDDELETSLQYTIEDAKGARATGLVMITVDEDVPLMAPIARDDSVLVEDVTEELTVDVDVLANDEDPDGTVQALTVESESGELVDHGVVRVGIGQERQLITYTITDEDDLSASAFIHVPAIDDLRPRLTTTEGIEVESGETVEIPLADHVTVHGGGSVRITQSDRVSAVHSDGTSLVADETTLVYTSRDGYFGPDAITFEATDGAGPDDPDGRTAMLSLPVTVLPPANQQPEFTNGALVVGAGDGPQTLDLRALTTDPDPDDLAGMTYRIVGGEGDGIDARIDGQSLVAEAAPDSKGALATIQLEIHDGTTDPITGTVEITVAASARPLPAANTDVLDDVHQGQSYTIDVLENDFNPFPDTPLRVVDARIDAGTGSLAFDDATVTVTPGSDFHGTMTVMYRIEDATQEVERQAQGRIEVTVLGRPDAPTEVSGSEEMNRAAYITWRPPSNNGSPITSYTVASVEGPAFTQECASTTCRLEPLVNGQGYRFAVTAHNDVGDSDVSLPSPVITPDQKPERPAAPRITDFGDRSLDVAWAEPVNEGTPIHTYRLYISPAPATGPAMREFDGSTFETRWEGLANGTNYTFTVEAHNDARDPSDRSRESVADHPAAPPNAPAAPSVAVADPVGAERQMVVTWSEVQGAETNGDPVDQYQVRREGGGQQAQIVGDPSAPATSQNVAVATSTSPYTYRVRGHNKAGWGEWSAASPPQRAVNPPPAPSNVRAAPADTTGVGGAVALTWTAPTQLNGASPGEVTYVITYGSGGRTTVSGASTTSTTVTGLANGTSYAFTVRTTVAGSGFSEQGGSASSNAVVPWGVPSAPSVSAAASGAQGIRFAASRTGSSNGLDLKNMQIEYNRTSSGSGSGSTSTTGTSWTETVNVGYSQSRCVRARVQNAENAWSPWSGWQCATSAARPVPAFSLSNSGVTSPYTGFPEIRLHYSNLPRGEYDIRCEFEGYPGLSQRRVPPYSIGGSGQQNLMCSASMSGNDANLRIRLHFLSGPYTGVTDWMVRR